MADEQKCHSFSFVKKLLIFLLLSLPLHAQRTNLTAEDAQTVTGPKAFTGGITNIGGCAATNGSQVVGNGTSFACQSKPFFDMRDYSPRTITLAAPTSAPTLTITTPVWGRNAFASGHTICAEQTYVGVDAGETTASGTNCVVISANHPAVAVFP